MYTPTLLRIFFSRLLCPFSPHSSHLPNGSSASSGGWKQKVLDLADALFIINFGGRNRAIHCFCPKAPPLPTIFNHK